MQNHQHQNDMNTPLENDNRLRSWLGEHFEVFPENLHHFRLALTTVQYEVLEHLGDAILGSVLAEYLISHHNVLKAKWFDDHRQSILNNDNLAKIAKRIELGEIIQCVVPHNDTGKDKKLADRLEALFGALYLEYGIEACRRIAVKLLALDAIDSTSQHQQEQAEEKIILDKAEQNPIGALNELLQHHGFAKARERVVGQSGPPHEPMHTYQLDCWIGDIILSTEGSASKSQKAIAFAALELLPQAQNQIAIYRKLNRQ
jgi:ribonuclease III